MKCHGFAAGQQDEDATIKGKVELMKVMGVIFELWRKENSEISAIYRGAVNRVDCQYSVKVR